MCTIHSPQVGRLLQAETYFMQMMHSGVIEINGDRATARFVERERGRGESTYYDSLPVYEDVLVREAHGWRFAERFYHYRSWIKSPLAAMHSQAPDPNSEERPNDLMTMIRKGGAFSEDASHLLR